jgi:chromosome partitioning protein
MARITVIANQKGGVGKTTTAHALSTGLTRKGYKTLAVDADPQGNLTYMMGADENLPGVYELLKGGKNPTDAVQATGQGDIIPGSLSLAGADVEFYDTGREYLLSEALEPLKDAYDFIIIDSPPQLGVLTINTLTATEDVIIPMGADILSLQGLKRLYATIGKVRKRCNRSLQIAGVLITRYNGRTILSKELRESIENAAQQISAVVFQSVIREGIAVKEAQTLRASLFESAPNSNASVDYLAFIDEYLKGETNHAEENI